MTKRQTIKKKFKHNKKRNTAFLYEALCNELTKTIVAKDTARQAQVMRILQEHFQKGTQLYTELQLYNVLTGTTGVKLRVAEKMITEVRKERQVLDDKELFSEQSRLIKRINIELGSSLYSNFVPDYKSLATIAQIFGEQSSVKDRIILEEKIVTKMSTPQVEEKTPMEHIDNLVFQTFSEKFNKAYKEKLHEEQQQVLTRYIFSFSDGGISLNAYLNEEIERLRSVINKSLTSKEIRDDHVMTENTNKVLSALDGFQSAPLDSEGLTKILKIQELVREVG